MSPALRGQWSRDWRTATRSGFNGSSGERYQGARRLTLPSCHADERRACALSRRGHDRLMAPRHLIGLVAAAAVAATTAAHASAPGVVVESARTAAESVRDGVLTVARTTRAFVF